MANASPNNALLERLKKARARPAPAEDTFYAGFSATPSAVMEPVAPVPTSVADEVTADRAGDETPSTQAPQDTVEQISSPPAQPNEGVKNKAPSRGRPMKVVKADASQTKTLLKISLTVRPELRERVEAYSQTARTRAQLVLRKVWDQNREAFLTKLADTLDVPPIEGARRSASKGLYYIGGLSVDVDLLERVLQRNDPHGLNGSGKVFKAWCDPLFNEAIDAELKKAGF
ncbi:hypothetical protein [Gemmobacter serpentinus]|uniref:hypothetical protein n=1 Tax=Gemmobacter serpentinus TaxID=2652247 RepID=UPI00124D0B24|nr:hypothetical protein [Gemmobacter serpentinus]